MPEQFDMIIRNARVISNSSDVVDIAILRDQIVKIEPRLDGVGQFELDAYGCLVSETFANPHLHLCKVFTLSKLDEAALKDYHAADMGKAMTAIEIAARVKEDYDQSWIILNARRAVALAAFYGCTHIRAFADVDNKARLEGVKALLQAREEFKGIVSLQVVAFAQDGIVREPGAAELMQQAMELGADVVGGIPWIEYTEADSAEHIRFCFDLAVKYNKPVSMLVDDAGDPGLRTLEQMAVETLRRGWQGRSLAHHARAMEMYPKPYVQKMAGLLKKADMGLVTDPHTGPLHLRVREMLEENVLVCLGQDDVSDAYYPYGRNNMLEVAFLASHLLWMTTREDMQMLYKMVTSQARKAMGVEALGVQPGAKADLVILDQPDILEAFRFHDAPRHVIRNGKIINLQKMRDISASGSW
jgi:cytosine deaminase